MKKILVFAAILLCLSYAVEAHHMNVTDAKAIVELSH